MFLGDGKHFAFRILGPENAGIYVASLDSPTPVRLAADESMLGYGAGHLFFVRGRTLMAHRIDEAGPKLVGEAIRVADDVDERPAVRRLLGIEQRHDCALARRVGAVAADVGLSNGDSAGHGRPARGLRKRRAFSGRERSGRRSLRCRAGSLAARHARRHHQRGLWHSSINQRPSGARTAAASSTRRRSTRRPICIFKRFDREGPDTRLFFDRMQCFPQGFSPDGRSLAYVTITPETANDIWLLDMSGTPGPDGYPRRPLLASRFTEFHSRISPDGRWLAYTSNESGVMNVYVAPFAQPGLKRSVSTNGGRFPVWSRDGRELYYVRSGQIIAVPVSVGDSLQLGTPTALFEARQSGGDSRNYHAVRCGARRTIHGQPVRRAHGASGDRDRQLGACAARKRIARSP